MAFVKNPGHAIELDGTRFVMPPLSLGQMEQLDEEQMQLLLGDEGGITKPRLKLYIDLIHAALMRNYPDLTREFIAGALDLGNMRGHLNALLSRSGLSKDEDAEPLGEEPAIEQPSGSTSSPSSQATPDGPSSTSASTSTDPS